jgi:acylglycerol lipase
MVEAVRGDPLYHNIVSARLGWDIMEWGQWLENQAGAFPVPLLIMQGNQDRIVNPAATIALAGRLSGNVTLKVWDGLYHELHNEPEREAVMQYMMSWVGRIAS